jgi:hypothetical protein
LKWEDGKVILIGIYVDDCLAIGKENQISMLITIKMEFVNSLDNDSDIFTKDVNHESYEKQARKFLQNKESGTWMNSAG